MASLSLLDDISSRYVTASHGPFSFPLSHLPNCEEDRWREVKLQVMIAVVVRSLKNVVQSVLARACISNTLCQHVIGRQYARSTNGRSRNAEFVVGKWGFDAS
jgi:hypothetical protein